MHERVLVVEEQAAVVVLVEVVVPVVAGVVVPVVALLTSGATSPAASPTRRVLLDVRTDDLQATGLVVPGPAVRGAPVEGMRLGVLVVVRAPTAHGAGSLPLPAAPVERRARDQVLSDRLRVVAVVLTGVQAVPHTRRTGRQRSRRVDLRLVVTAAVPGRQGVVGVVAGAVGPPLGLDDRTGLLEPPVQQSGDPAAPRRRPVGRGPPGGVERVGRRFAAPRGGLVAGRLVARSAVAGVVPTREAAGGPAGQVEAGAESRRARSGAPAAVRPARSREHLAGARRTRERRCCAHA